MKWLLNDCQSSESTICITHSIICCQMTKRKRMNRPIRKSNIRKIFRFDLFSWSLSRTKRTDKNRIYSIIFGAKKMCALACPASHHLPHALPLDYRSFAFDLDFSTATQKKKTVRKNKQTEYLYIFNIRSVWNDDAIHIVTLFQLAATSTWIRFFFLQRSHSTFSHWIALNEEKKNVIFDRSPHACGMPYQMVKSLHFSFLWNYTFLTILLRFTWSIPIW